MQTLKFKKIRPEAVIPKYETAGAVGFDFTILDNFTISPGQTLMIGTGLSVEFPAGYELALLPRSSTGVKHSIALANTQGVIDSDYRGEILCALYNFGTEAKSFQAGSKLIQGILRPIERCEILEVTELSVTDRGAGGFGSTDKTPPVIPDSELFVCGKRLIWAKPTSTTVEICRQAGSNLLDVLLRFTNDVGEVLDEVIVESVYIDNLLVSTDKNYYIKHYGYWKQVFGIRPAAVPF